MVIKNVLYNVTKYEKPAKPLVVYNIIDVYGFAVN